jgi:hypothetical protein
MTGKSEEPGQEPNRLEELDRSMRQLERARVRRSVITAVAAAATVILPIVVVLSGEIGNNLLKDAAALDSKDLAITPVLLTALLSLGIAATALVLFRDEREARSARSSAREAREAIASADARYTIKSKRDESAGLSSTTVNVSVGAGYAGDIIISDLYEDNRPSDYIDILMQFRKRMNSELVRLKTNSRVNLIWGILFTSLGMIFTLFTVTVYTASNVSNVVDLIMTYGPRITLVSILEIVGFFFLRLYNSTEQEIKHHKNEVTNMEAKFAAAMYSKDSQLTLKQSVVRGLSSTERNFVLKKGERTVSFDGDGTYNDILSLFDKIQGLVKASKVD